jgi:hypothetical protein
MTKVEACTALGVVALKKKTALDASAEVLWTNPLDTEESIESI